MFTGIIVSRGVIVERLAHKLVIDAPAIDEGLGDSIAVDGCCLTVVSSEDAPKNLPQHRDSLEVVATKRVSFDILPETLKRTRLGQLSSGDFVNLEPALRAGDPLGGHMVQGHVDATGELVSRSVDEVSGALNLQIRVPEEISKLSIERGSITINGVSLTIMELEKSLLRVQLIPETQVRTNLSELQIGELVNLEADVIARYVNRLIGVNR